MLLKTDNKIEYCKIIKDLIKNIKINIDFYKNIWYFIRGILKGRGRG